jgi:hypothetical protein
MRTFKGVLAAASLCMSFGAAGQSSNYDSATNLLTIPSVQTGAATYVDVTLRNIGEYTFTLQGATPQVPPGTGVASYDSATAVLTLPLVMVGYSSYINVTLRNVGNYTFTLLSATAQDPMPTYPPYQPN